LEALDGEERGYRMQQPCASGDAGAWVTMAALHETSRLSLFLDGDKSVPCFLGKFKLLEKMVEKRRKRSLFSLAFWFVLTDEKNWLS
jgi:hypothetical protein